MYLLVSVLSVATDPGLVLVSVSLRLVPSSSSSSTEHVLSQLILLVVRDIPSLAVLSSSTSSLLLFELSLERLKVESGLLRGLLLLLLEVREVVRSYGLGGGSSGGLSILVDGVLKRGR
jgi:hypothetical protein